MRSDHVDRGERRCENCAYSSHERHMANVTLGGQAVFYKSCDCHRFPPPNTEGHFPQMSHNDWCGEWEPCDPTT